MSIFSPDDKDPYKGFIERRREIAKRYWIERPQIERIFALMLWNLASITIIFSEEVFGIDIHNEVAYIMIMLGIFWNEITMAAWRRRRNIDLNKIE